jgi:catechol 2,3-dioxygenase-like lactoylglutathione lyase family enzyme
VIKGLYEAHLPVTDLDRSISFYEKLGLTLWFREDPVAVFWIVPRVSCLGLWKTEISPDRNPGSFPGNGRHVAFLVDFENIDQAIKWLTDRGISPVSHNGFSPNEPIVRPHLGNASVYFDDPDGNNLELICNLPTNSDGCNQILSMSEWRNQTREIKSELVQIKQKDEGKGK